MSESPKQYPLRLPPNLYERLQGRSAANGRSINSEILEMLERGLGELQPSDLRALYDDGLALEVQILAARTSLAHMEARLEAIHEQIRQHIGRDMGDHDPLQYAWVYMQSELEKDGASAIERSEELTREAREVVDRLVDASHGRRKGAKRRIDID